MTIRFLRAARTDLRDAVRYYESQSPGLGAEFRAEVRSAIERIEALSDACYLLKRNHPPVSDQAIPLRPHLLGE